MKDVLQVVAFNRLLGIKEFQKVLHELGGHVDFQGADLDGLVDHKLQEELVDALEVGPGGVHLFLLVDAGLSEAQVAFLYVGQGPENVLLDHLHDLVQVGDDEAGHVLLVLQHLLQLLDRVEALRLALHVPGLVLVVIVLHAHLQLLKERIF